MTTAPKPNTAPPAPGRPRFTLGDQIGGGPLGSLHRGEDLVESKAVLLRLLAPELLSIQGALQALTGDLKNAAAVSHPALVRTLGFVDLNGRRAIVSDWVTGRHFGEAIAAGHKLPPGQIASLSKALLQALAAIHAKGLAHGSVQPSNVMVSAGQVRLADFGLGRVRQRFPSSHRAPDGGYSAAADVYAAAALFYQLMTGVNPIGNAAPAAPGTLVSGVPQALGELLVRCLAPQASDRPSSEQALQAL